MRTIGGLMLMQLQDPAIAAMYVRSDDRLSPEVAGHPGVGDDLELLPADEPGAGAVNQVREAVLVEEVLHPGGRQAEDLGCLGGREPVGAVVVGVGVPRVGVHREVLDLVDGGGHLVGPGAGELVVLEDPACLAGWEAEDVRPRRSSTDP